jgi:hypothetical protein
MLPSGRSDRPESRPFAGQRGHGLDGKNHFVLEQVVEAMRGMRTVGVIREDSDANVREIAEPVGAAARRPGEPTLPHSSATLPRPTVRR